MGCGRTLDEIMRWGDAQDKERLEILECSKERLKGMKKIWPFDEGGLR